MKECCDVLYHNYVDPATRPYLPDPTSDLAGSGSESDSDTLDPSRSFRIWIRCHRLSLLAVPSLPEGATAHGVVGRLGFRVMVIHA